MPSNTASRPVRASRSPSVLLCTRSTLKDSILLSGQSIRLSRQQRRSPSFNSVVPVVNTLNAHSVGAGDQLFFSIDVPIVETIIRKLLFDPDANDETVKSALMMLEQMHAATGDENATPYRVHIKNVKLFKLVVGQVALGCSFRLASRQIALVREELYWGI
jgi:hypothetical protein